MGNRRSFLVNEIVKYSQRLDQKGFGANHDGNISVKFDNALLATPTAVSKGNVTSDIIITLDKDGNKIDGIGKPFSEIKLHLAAYRARPEMNAVVHAHPPYATARGLLNLPLHPSLPEAVVSIGDIIPVVAFAMPGAKENESIIADALVEADVFMMPGNGVLAVGTCVEHAYLQLELVEHLSKIDHYARAVGTPMSLSANDIANLVEKRMAIGLGPKKNQVISSQKSKPTQDQQSDDLKKVILEEVKKVLQSVSS